MRASAFAATVAVLVSMAAAPTVAHAKTKSVRCPGVYGYVDGRITVSHIVEENAVSCKNAEAIAWDGASAYFTRGITLSSFVVPVRDVGPETWRADLWTADPTNPYGTGVGAEFTRGRAKVTCLFNIVSGA